MNAWDHLPNGALVEAMVADAHRRPHLWREAYNTMLDHIGKERHEDAWRTVWYSDPTDAHDFDARRDPYRAVRGLLLQNEDRALDGAFVAVSNPVLALGVHDEAADMLKLPVPAFNLLVGSGSAPAILLLPAMLVFGPL